MLSFHFDIAFIDADAEPVDFADYAMPAFRHAFDAIFGQGKAIISIVADIFISMY